MSYVVRIHLDNLYVLSKKTVGPRKKSKINKRIGPRSIPGYCIVCTQKRTEISMYIVGMPLERL